MNLSRVQWNEIVAGSAIPGSDHPLPHSLCGWDLCEKPSEHTGPCRTVPAKEAHGELAYSWGMGPCPSCPLLTLPMKQSAG
jgi:hypothetical protein